MEYSEKAFLIFIILINIYGIYIVYKDKQYAKGHKWRISERNILMVAFFFGSLGVLIGMRLFRHKTKHLKFIILVPIFLIIQVIIMIVLSGGVKNIYS
jgi:uncharacterized membrane protein YsdA (DUF1294 family)